VSDSSFDRARRLFRLQPDPAADVSEEIRFHLDAAIQEGIAAGRSPEEARTEALERFGDIGTLTGRLHQLQHEGNRIMHRREWLGALRQDLKFGGRQLRKSPGFTTVALLTLALGIGANTAIFSVVYSVLLRPLPFANQDRIVDIRQSNGAGNRGRVVPFPNFLAWERESRAFAAIGGYVWQSFTLTGAGDAQRLQGNRMSAGYWRAARIAPVLGRYYTEADDHYGGRHVVVLSFPLWRSRFGGDSTIVGRSVLLDDVPYTVVAVAGRGYSMVLPGPEFWVPLAATPEESSNYGDHELAVVGLLKPGVNSVAGAHDLSRIDAGILKEHPDKSYDGGIVVKPMLDVIVARSRRRYLVLLGAVGLVLLIACANVANLLLARAMTRRAEFAVRAALGAGAGRIVTQLLVECGTIALGGAILGIAVGAAGIRLLMAISPPGVPRMQDASLNPVVLGFAVALAAVSALVFGLAPAIRASRTDLQQTLRAGGRESRGASGDRLRGALIVIEVALALVLLTGAGLLIRSAQRLGRVAPGFDAANLLTAHVALPTSRYPSDSSVGSWFSRFEDAVRAIPGVSAAAMISRVPIEDGGYDCTARPDVAPAPGLPRRDANFRSVTPGYFATMRTPVLRGREFTAADGRGAPPVVVINASLAHALFRNANPVGQRLVHCDDSGGANQKPSGREVVGVIADVRANGLAQDPADEVYYPEAQTSERTMTVVLRGSVTVQSLLPVLRRTIAAIDPQLPLSNVATMGQIMREETASSRFTTSLLISLGGSGLLLAAIGVYGVIACFVSQRTHELGIRIALGASSNRVRSMVVRQGLALAALGVLVGEIIALLASRVLSTMVYGVTVHDPVTFVSVGLILGVIAIAASFVPAWRATRIDPLTALRA
jgi:putative ABC transport system permease protein